MPNLTVQINAFVDDHQPGFVECRFVDAGGASHVIIEKVPVVSLQNLGAKSTYPQTGSLACLVVEEVRDGQGHTLKVSTAEPFHIESITGQTTFTVQASSVTTLRPEEAEYLDGLSLTGMPCHAGPVLVAVAQANRGSLITAECPYCGERLTVETRGLPPSAWIHKCGCGRCNGSFRGL